MNGFARGRKISAKFRAELHKFYDGDFQNRPGGAGLPVVCTFAQKAGFLRAGEAGNERALRGGIGSVLSAPIFAPLRLAAASFSVRRDGLRQKKSPCQRAAEGLRAVWSVAAVLAVPVVVGVSLAGVILLPATVRKG